MALDYLNQQSKSEQCLFFFKYIERLLNISFGYLNHYSKST